MTCDPRRGLAALAALLALSAGCSAPTRVKVSGRVTLDGADLSEGEIRFVPADPSRGAEGGKVVAGRFEVAVWPGAHRVEVRAARELPRKGEFAYFEEVIPERYNAKTELTLDVPPAGRGDVHFELTGAGPK